MTICINIYLRPRSSFGGGQEKKDINIRSSLGGGTGEKGH